MKKFNDEQRKAAGVQQSVFDLLDTIPDVAPHVKHRVMYYVTRSKDTEMLETFDEHGFPIWREHDLMRYQPHIINCVRRAQRIAHELGGQARSCIKDDIARRYLPISVKLPNR